MSAFNFRLPHISANTEKEQLAQIKNYLYQMTEQLQWALNSLDTSTTVEVQTAKSTTPKTTTDNVIDAQATFNAIKSLIIKSADIVNAYYEEIGTRLEGEFAAVSDFGDFKEDTALDILANSENISNIFTNLQTITTDIENIQHTLVYVNAHIRAGLLYTNDNGVPIYGVEVGQKNTIDGEEVFNQYARFTADRLSFYDHNGTEVAYISDYKLYITNAAFTGTVVFGAFQINTTKGFRLKYVGRG